MRLFFLVLVYAAVFALTWNHADLYAGPAPLEAPHG